ncbi:hypothetical protein G5V59_11185 [Nocardioides sp. W3-2-3]|uniref:hypothetical protein n=1 Tax=Nocardioides convexus TaxID=2712224 RepID=UPI002418A722|nr:hypothetical protein [Nocardioides convexus]NHA00436.1 hypothetical protein [Nocardioides convexus]
MSLADPKYYQDNLVQRLMDWLQRLIDKTVEGASGSGAVSWLALTVVVLGLVAALALVLSRARRTARAERPGPAALTGEVISADEPARPGGGRAGRRRRVGGPRRRLPRRGRAPGRARADRGRPAGDGARARACPGCGVRAAHHRDPPRRRPLRPDPVRRAGGHLRAGP